MKAIAAMAKNRIIGNNGKIPWYLPEDFKWFKEQTINGTVIMGRKTFESLRKPLPARNNIVISKTSNFDNVITYSNLNDIPLSTKQKDSTWIIGGSEIYKQTLPECTDLYLSILNENKEGDTYFPDFESYFKLKNIIKNFKDFSIFHYIRV